MLEHAHGSMVIGEKVYKMRKLVFKYIVLLLLVSLSISGCTYDNNDDITYKTISMSSVTLEIPSSYAKGNEYSCSMIPQFQNIGYRHSRDRVPHIVLI